MTTSLNQYAAQTPRTPARSPRCSLCHAPSHVLAAVLENEDRLPHLRHPRKVVAAWATTEAGFTISTDIIYRHLNHP